MVGVEGILRISIYGALIICFLALPITMAFLHRFILRKIVSISSLKVFGGFALLQLLIIMYLALQPVITYDKTITKEDINKYGEWARTKLERPWAGVYSTNIPILAYRFHITELNEGSVVSEVHYFPIGDMIVKWDGLYGIIKPLSGL